MELAYPKYTAILAAAAVIVRDGRLLLLEDRWGRWGLPSGFVEKGESAEETLRREVLEELGVECRIVAPRGIDIDWAGPEGTVFVLMHYVVSLASDDFAPNEEVVRFAWVAPDEVSRYNVWPNVARLAERLAASPGASGQSIVM
jgi:8-oxo-dGTP pyrophosphatase MutT (NUDIX family)